MKEIENIKSSELKERIEFFHNEYHRLRTESVMENNPTTKHSIEKNMQEALAQKESAENLLKNISKEETRHEQYLRILTSGINDGESDYAAVKYLKDKGYTESPILIANRKIAALKWTGPSSSGLDYIDELKARIKVNNSEIPSNESSNSESYSDAYGINQKIEWHNTFKGKIVVGITIGLIMYFIVGFLS